MRDILDYQADQIERVLASHGVPVRVYGGSVSARLVEFHVAPSPGVKIARIEQLAEELALYLGVGACRVQRRGAVVSIEVPKDHPPVVSLLTILGTLGQALPEVAAVLGQDGESVPILLRLSSPDVAHVLIAGTTGSGKTELAKTMILSLALRNPPAALRFLLIDPKGRGYRAFNGIPHLICPVISDVSEAQSRLSGLIAEMERRDRAGEAEPRVLVFVDELADLMMVGGRPMMETLTRLTQRGREAGIHIVACTQKPTAGVVGSIAKSNFPARLVGSVSSADDARIAAGVSGSGAEKLAGRGDFLLIVKGECQRLQAAYIAPDDLEAAVRRLGQAPTPTHQDEQDGAHAETADGHPPTRSPSIADQRGSTRDDRPPTPAGAPAARIEGDARTTIAPPVVLPVAPGPPDAGSENGRPFVWTTYNDFLRVGYHRR